MAEGDEQEKLYARFCETLRSCATQASCMRTVAQSRAVVLPAGGMNG